MDELLSEFLTECRAALDKLDADLRRLERSPSDEAALADILRRFHTIKGSCGFLRLSRLEAIAHAAESVLAEIRDGERHATSWIFDALRSACARIQQILDALADNEAEPKGGAGLGNDRRQSPAARAARAAGPLPWLSLLVRRLAEHLGKEMELSVTVGADALEPVRHELVHEVLLHLVRNAADHGIEPPAERLALGKPRCGVIGLEAVCAGGRLIVRLSDDGRGLDLARIRARAMARGLVTTASDLSDARMLDFVLAAGLSTAAKVGPTSGRGIGLDVVRANLERLGGSLDVVSVPGRGASFTLTIPTASIARLNAA